MSRLKIPFFVFIYTLTAFLGASLLFVVQPMVGRLVLPIFGGVSTVWTTVMLFFTTVLLFGYGYVVWLTSRPKKQQLIIHTILVLVGMIFLVLNFWKTRTFLPVTDLPLANNLPFLSLLLIIGNALAIPCFLLATTSSLIQYWYAHFFTKKSPYWIYIISNIGSLVGLISYPFIVEPRLTLGSQQGLWTTGFIVYGFLMLAATLLMFLTVKGFQINPKPLKLTLSTNWTWFALPFISTTAMLAFTNQLTQEIAPFPFIWVGTLGVYLLSFVVAFIDGKWYPRKFYGVLLLSLLGIMSVFFSGIVGIRFQHSYPFALMALFIIDLVAHRELYRRRPNPSGLAVYYLLISLGGAVASIFVAVIAPSIFPGMWEFPLVLILSAITGVMVLYRKSGISFRLHSGVLGTLVSMVVLWSFFIYPRANLSGDPNAQVVASFRNFYGVIEVVKRGFNKPYSVEIISGKSSHGIQIIGNNDEFSPWMYYSRGSGVEYAILNHTKRINKSPMRFGVIGLGAGMIAAYCGNGDNIRFYEINPHVIQASSEYFTYIKNAQKSGCNTEVIQGDARVSLDKELKNGRQGEYDVLVIDAFTDLNIPVHLLTLEALDIYLSHAAKDGVIVFHSISPYLDLSSELQALSATRKLYFSRLDKGTDRWVLISRSPIGAQSYIPGLQNTNMPVWTDNYSDILRLFKR